MDRPQLVFLFSGKRKSGKDYICEQLNTILGTDCEIVRISGPLKKLYAEHHNLKWGELMSAGPYKEHYRKDMINWSDEVRKEDPGFFCKAACTDATPRKVWIVSDIRRKSDIQWFRENYPNFKTVRITAELDVRKERGWEFTKGIDDVASECDLDDFMQWDIQLSNNSADECNNSIACILDIIKEYFSS